MSDAALQVTNVSMTFGVTKALSDVSMRVDNGSSVALVGRNGAGKSTLVSVITGLLNPDSGTVEFHGHGAQQVGCVYQRSTLIPWLTAAENISLQRFPRNRLGLVDWPRLRGTGRELLSEWNCERIANSIVADLEPVERKVVEICRVLSLDPNVLVLDEPTAGLDFGGAKKLFGHIQDARARGVAIVYVSHHLQEIFEVCDRTTVLRDGRVVFDESLSGLSVSDVVDAMVGSAQDGASVRPLTQIDTDRAPLLTVESISIADRVTDVSFGVRPGECLGITGLEGSGHVEVAEALCGLERPTSGQVRVADKALKAGDVSISIKAGIGFVPEDRHVGGYVPALSVAENATLPVVYRIANRARLISSKVRNSLYRALADEWAIKAWGPEQPIEELSGGNQQKVVLARALSSDPDVLVLMNPTAGVDVAAKQSIYGTVGDLIANKRTGVVIVSADDADFGLCHSVLVMFQGKIHRRLLAPFAEAELAAAIQGR